MGQDADTSFAAGVATPVETEGRQRLWSALLVAVALLLIAETIVASRSWRGTAGRFTPAIPDRGGS